jgi:LysM repeat protein
MGNWRSLRSGLFRLAVMLCVGGILGGCGYDQVVQTWVAYSEESGPAEGPKLPGHIYLLRGLTTVYSFGIDQLAAKINHRGVSATVYGLSDGGAIASDIVRKYKSGEDRGPVMLLGHSSGADYAIAIAERLKEVGVPVALAFGFDPTRVADAVPANVELFINLYQGANLIGGGEVQPATDFRGRLIEVDLREHTEIVHITLDKTPAVQDAVADKVIAVAAYAARRPKEPPRRLAGAELRPLLLKYSVPGSAPIVLWDDAVQVKVKPGETLESIASTYQAPAWAIVQVNKLDADRSLEPGRMLTIPRSLYANVTPPGAPSPPAARPAPPPPVARLAPTPQPQVEAPAAPKPATPTPAAVSVPKPVESAPVRDPGSFSDRWRSDTEQ